MFHISAVFQPLNSPFSGQTATDNEIFSKTIVRGTFREVVSDYNYCFLSIATESRILCFLYYYNIRKLFTNKFVRISYVKYYYFYPRDAMLARVIAITTCLSVRPSVCLSVTRRYCVKTKKASGTISSPSGSPKTIVFWRQISSPNSKGSPRKGASNKGLSEKFSDYLALSVYISKTVADAAKVTISD